MKHVLLTVVFLGIACVAMAHELSSPNGNLKLNVVLDSEGILSHGRTNCSTIRN